MTSEWWSAAFPEAFQSGLAVREWAISRIDAWASKEDGPSAFLVRGSPGSGKSTLLAQYLARLESSSPPGGNPIPRIIATVLRHPIHQEPFDAAHFLADIVKGLADFAPVASVAQFAAVPQITVNQQNIGQAEMVTGVVLQLGMSPVSGLLALAEQRVRATPRTERALIVVDALDQAEDEVAEEFLRAVAAMVRAAEGTGVRILCSSRTGIPIWLDPAKRLELDLVKDADDLDSELSQYLNGRFQGVGEEERVRIIDALMAGAHGNWLWASTNATAIENEIAATTAVPHHLNLTEGLSGLYSDGWRRIRQRVASHAAEARAKKILGAVACSFTGSLGLAEIRWATGIDPDEIMQLLRECEPFLVLAPPDKVRSFHPDFSRWLFQADEVGLSESSEHLRLARGLTRFGQAMRWREDAERYAAQWVLNHWCSVLIFDPFRPDAEKHEEELASLLADPDWGNHSGSSLETIEQLGLVAPRLRLPGHNFPLLAGLRALQASVPIDGYVWYYILQRLGDEEVDELFALGEGRRKWLEERLSDLPLITSRALWGGLLLGCFRIDLDSAGITVRPRARAVLKTLVSSGERISRRSWVASDLAAAVAPEDRYDLLRDLQDRLTKAPTGWAVTAQVNQVLGRIYRAQSAEKPAEDRADDQNLAVAAYTEALDAAPPGHESRLTFAIDLANALIALPERSAGQQNLLIAVQTEIRDERRDAGDPNWPQAADLLGDAYRGRAEEADRDEADRAQDLELAVAAYTEALDAAPPDHDRRLIFAVDLANALRSLPARSPSQQELLIAVQTEIRDRKRDADDADWPRSANLLGDAYRDRAEEADRDEADRAQDLELAVAAYTEALDAAPPEYEWRLVFAMDVADALRILPVRSAAQVELRVTTLIEIRDRKRAADDPAWPLAADLLGDAYRERAESRAEQADREEEDLGLAVAAYTEALDAAPPDHESRLMFAVDLANALRILPARSASQQELLITVETEIRDGRRDADDPDWPRSANLLGDSYRERAESSTDKAARDENRALAVTAYTEAWEAVPPDHESRLTFAVDLVDTLIDLPGRTAAQMDLRIAAQAEIRDRRRDADQASWPRSANLLGDAYRERAESRAEQADREEDLDRAVAAYTEAWEAVPPGHESRLMFAIDLANTIVVQAAIRPAGTMDGRVVVDRALNLVSAAIADREADSLAELRGLLPVLSVRLVRQQWSWI